MGQPKRTKTTHRQIKLLSVLVACAWSWPALALDLGRLQTLSAIGEPLRAEIDIAQASPEELRSLTAQLATPASFLQAGMEFNPALAGLTTRLENRANGTAYIALNGRTPIQDNFVDLILEAQWAGGRLVKNYALLLNSVKDRPLSPSPSVTSVSPPQLALVPPTQALVQPVPTLSTQTSAASSRLQPTSVELNAQRIPVYRFEPVNNAVVAPPNVNAAPAQTTRTEDLRAPAVSAPSSSALNQAGKAEMSVLVQPGDTASRLAVKHLAAHVSLDQMLLAMLKANPEAFIDGNVNLIKAGAQLRMPAAEEATQISRSEARQTVIAQTRDFAEYARRLAESPLLVGTKNTRELSGKVTTEVLNADGQTPQQDKLTLSKPEANASRAESRLAAEREAKDTADQLAALNKNLQDLEALAKPGQTTPTTSPTGSSLTQPNTPTPTETASSLEQLKNHPQIWLWAAGLLAAMLLLVLWIRQKPRDSEEVFAPSYNDAPLSDPPVAPVGTSESAQIPPQMASIDLNLPTHSVDQPQQPAQAMGVSDSAAAPSRAVSNTEQSKLTLAEQLLGQGEHDLARALILSVASSASGELKARALQLLGQIR